MTSNNKVAVAAVSAEKIVDSVSNVYVSKHRAKTLSATAKEAEGSCNVDLATWFTANIGDNWHLLNARLLRLDVQKEAEKHGIPVEKAVLFLYVLDKLLFPKILKGIKTLEKGQPKEAVEKIAKKYFDSAMQQVRGFCNGRNEERAAKKRQQRAEAAQRKTAAEKDPLGNWRTRVNGLHSEFNNLVDKEGLAGLDKMRSVHAEVTAHFQAIIKLTL